MDRERVEVIGARKRIANPSRKPARIPCRPADDRLLPGAAAKLEDALSATGVASDIKEYPGRWPQLHERVEDTICASRRRTRCGHPSFGAAGLRRVAPMLAFFDAQLR